MYIPFIIEQIGIYISIAWNMYFAHWICHLHAEQRHTEPFQDWIKHFKVVETVFSSEMVRKIVPQSCSCKHEWFFAIPCSSNIASACFIMSFIFVLFMLHLLTVCALYVCLCDYVKIYMYLVLLCIFGKKLITKYANLNEF
jgi:hypothetical protein